MAGKELFRLPIAETKGGIVVTEPQPQVYLISFASPPDNRLLTVGLAIHDEVLADIDADEVYSPSAIPCDSRSTLSK